MSNLSLVTKRIQRAETTSHLKPQSVRLLAVSKTKSAQMIESVYTEGQHAFGENYLQEALKKQKILTQLDIEWHFIGAIQSNKAKSITQNFHWVHTVDRLKIAEKLNQHAEHALNICIQVNTSLEDSKAGCLPEETAALAHKIQSLPNLVLRGMMVIPKPQSNYDAQLNECQKAKKLFDTLNQEGFALDTLSMGMSNDLEAAIASGSTMVRIGTDIFGSRT